MEKELNRPSPPSASWITTRNLVIAFAVVEAIAIGAALAYIR